MACKYCGCPTAQLGKTIMSSGAYHIWQRCERCGRNAKGEAQFISKSKLNGLDPDTLPVFLNYLRNSEPCEVCGNPGTESHHWAPRELFPDTFEEWPKTYLCKIHHNEWHRKITTPLRTLKKRVKK